MADILTHSTLTTGLVSYWELEEASGNRVDSHGSNDLSAGNSPGNITGILGSGVDLENGSDQYLEITDAAQTGLDITNDVSISAWIKLEQLPSTAGESFVIVSKYKWTAGARSYQVHLTTADKLVAAYYSPTVKYAQDVSNSAIVTGGDVGNWVHIVATIDSSAQDIKLYKNGSLVASTLDENGATSILNSAAPFTVGTFFSGYESTAAFDGGIDELGIWSKVLTSDEVSDLYNSGSGLAYEAATGGSTYNSIFAFGGF